MSLREGQVLTFRQLAFAFTLICSLAANANVYYVTANNSADGQRTTCRWNDETQSYYYSKTSTGNFGLSADTEGVAYLSPLFSGTPITGIDSHAFEGCDKITEFRIPEEITDIAEDAFEGCESLTNVIIGATSVPCETHGETRRILFKRADYKIDGLAKHYCVKCMKIAETEIIPATPTIINGGPFTNQLENTYLVFQINNGNAYLCSAHEYDPCIDPNTTGRIVIPETLRVDDHDYPVGTIGDLAFFDCLYITEVFVPASVTQLFYYSFLGTPSLKRIVFEGDAPGLWYREFEDCPATVYARYGTKGWGDVPGDFGGAPLDWIDPPEPRDITKRSGLLGQRHKEWSFGSGANGYTYSPSNYKLEGTGNSRVVFRFGVSGVHDSSYLDIKAPAEIMFPFEADLQREVVTFYLQMNFDNKGATEEGLSIGLKNHFTMSTYSTGNGGKCLKIVADKTYLTNVPLEGWNDFTFRLEEDGFSVKCNGEAVVCEGKSYFMYENLEADSHMNGIYLKGYGSVDEGLVRKAQSKTLVDFPKEVLWTFPAKVPQVEVIDAFRGTLTEGVDYITTYDEYMTPGTARLKVTGVGIFKGSIEKTFEVVCSSEERPTEVADGTTEIEGIKVPNSWLLDYGVSFDAGDIISVLNAPTGKKTAGGRPIKVWEEYVLGTNLSDSKDEFKVSVEMIDGKPVITYEPDLGDARKYTTLGSNDLRAWTPVEGDAADYKFFKVDVEIRSGK